MLYYLFQWLDRYDFPGAGMFLALLISSIWGDRFIHLLKRKQITETQRDAKTDPFGVQKVGVPSMGGIIIIVAILIPCLLLGRLGNIYMLLMLITTVWLGSLGFADDYIKIFKKDKEGLHGKFKIIGQVGLGLIVGLTLYLSPQVVIRENIEVRPRRPPSPSSRATTWTMPTSWASWATTPRRRAGCCSSSSPSSS